MIEVAEPMVMERVIDDQRNTDILFSLLRKGFRIINIKSIARHALRQIVMIRIVKDRKFNDVYRSFKANH